MVIGPTIVCVASATKFLSLSSPTRSQMPAWYVKKDGRLFGPYDDSQLERLIEKGSVNEDSLLRDGPTGDWRLASLIPGVLADHVDESDIRVPAFLQTNVPTERDDSFAADELRPDAFDTDAFDTPASTTAAETTLAPSDAPRPSGVQEPRDAEQVANLGQPPLPSGPPSGPPSRRSAFRPTSPVGQPVQHITTSARQASDAYSGNALIAGLLSAVVPGSGHIYLGVSKLGGILMGLVPLLYIVLWWIGITIVQVSIQADIKLDDTVDAHGRMTTAEVGSGFGATAMVVAVLMLFLTPIVVHVFGVVHAVQLANE